MDARTSPENKPAGEPQAGAVALVTDLIFATKITSTAASLGVAVRICRNSSSLVSETEAVCPPTAIVDLNADVPDPVDAIRQLRALNRRPRIIAYVSHVQADLARAAREAGADDVMPRSAFAANLPDLLRGNARRTDVSVSGGRG